MKRTGKVIVGVAAGLVIAGVVSAFVFLPGFGLHQPAKPSTTNTPSRVNPPAATVVQGNTSPGAQTALELYQRQYQPALSLFNQALALDPRCYQALNAKGATYAFLGRYDEGIGMIQQALTMKPDFEYAHFNLGLANELAGRWDQAIAAYQSAIALDNRLC